MTDLSGICILWCRLFSVFLATLDLKAFDVKALRAFRVLRPLKLVSGVPSTYIAAPYIDTVVSFVHSTRAYVYKPISPVAIFFALGYIYGI